MQITILQPGDIIHVHSPELDLPMRMILAQRIHRMTGHPAIVTRQPISIIRPADKEGITLAEGETKAAAADATPVPGTQPGTSSPITAPPAPGTSPDPIPITRPGHHAESGLWFFADSVFSDDGCLIEAGKPTVPFERGQIIDIEGTRYLIDYDTGTAPIMEPRKAARAGALEQLLAALHKTHGTGAYLAIGGIIAYAFAPETLARYNAAPGIWIHGRKASGKSTMARILMAFWGMDTNARFETHNTTLVAIEWLITHFSSIPVHFDNYRESDKPGANSTLRKCFNRQSTTKGRFDSNTTATITPGTSPLITGEGRPVDAATASRYIMVECGNKLSKPSVGQDLIELAWQTRLIPNLFIAGRDKAADTFNRILKNWLVNTGHLDNDRQRIVMGIAYAAFATAIGEQSEQAIELKAHVVANLGGSVATTEPELPPLGHNLTFPKDAKKIQYLGMALPEVICALRKVTDSTYDEAHQELISYRFMALQHNRPDHELFACILAWSKIMRTGQALRHAVETSLAAAEADEKPTE